MKRKNSNYKGYGSYKSDLDEKQPKKRKKVLFRTGAAAVRGLAGNTSRVTQGVGTSAAAALGFITMNVPGAMIGGAYAYNYLDPVSPVASEDHMMELVHAALGFPKNKMPVPYNQGSFRAPSKVKRTLEDIYSSYGCYKVNEQFGAVNGSEVVYLAANSFRIDSFAYTVSIAMLRKLFRMIGREINDPVAPIVPGGLSEAYRLRLKYENDNGNVLNVNYNTTANQSLVGLAYDCGIVPNIESYIQAQTGDILTEIEISILDYRTTTTTPPVEFVLPRYLAVMNLKNEKVNLHMSCEVVVQNRTRGASESNNQVDLIDSQPLKGYLYYFKKNTPQIKQQNTVGPAYTRVWTPFERTTYSGIILINGNAAVDDAMKDPPSPGFFSNCSKASYVKLEPGAMKKFYVENNYNKYYIEILRAASRYTGSPSIVGGTVWKRQSIADTMMIALEEVLNSGSANKITIQYEGEIRTGAYFVTGPVPTMKKLYEQQNVNALDA